LVQSFDLYFNLQEMMAVSPGQVDGWFDASSGNDMIILDQHTVPKVMTVILAASDAHRIFFQQAPSRSGFACVNDVNIILSHSLDVLPCQGSDARKSLQEIQRHTFASQE